MSLDSFLISLMETIPVATLEVFSHIWVMCYNKLNGVCKRGSTLALRNTLLQRELWNPIWKLKDEREHTADKLSVFEFT